MKMENLRNNQEQKKTPVNFIHQIIDEDIKNNKSNTIVLKRNSAGCFICDEINDTLEFKEKIICKNCIKDISKIFN